MNTIDIRSNPASRRGAFLQAVAAHASPRHRRMPGTLCGFLVLLALHAPAAPAADATVGTCDQDHLQAALSTVNHAPGGTITFTCTGTITLMENLSPYYVDHDVAMVIDGANRVVLDGGDLHAFWQVYGDGSLTLKRLTLQRAGTGGAPAHPIQSFGRLTLDNVTVKANRPATSIVDIEAGTLTVTGSTFSSNGAGDGILYNLADALVQNSTFSDNTLASGSGTAIRNHGGTLHVTGSTFANNSVGGNGSGGAISNENGGSLDVTGSTFNANGALDGGAIENDSGVTGVAHVAHSTFTGNTAGYGGAIENFADSTLHLDHDTFASNLSSNIGGAIWNEGGTVSVDTSAFDGNKAARLGGAIECDNDNLFVSGSTFSVNKSNSGNTDASNHGGAIYSTCHLVVGESTFQANSAQNAQGGAIYQGNAAFAGVYFSTFVANTAMEGAAISSNGGNALQIAASLLAANTHGHTCAGFFASVGYNLADDADCGGALDAPTDQPNVTLAMGPLADNGGPTRTIAPAAGNPAINDIPRADGLCSDETFDQRGYVRPAGVGCDSGSVEVGAIDDVVFRSGFEWN